MPAKPGTEDMALLYAQSLNQDTGTARAKQMMPGNAAAASPSLSLPAFHRPPRGKLHDAHIVLV